MKWKNLASLNVDFSNHILKITLNRPDTSNAINYEMINSLVSTLNEAEKDFDVRAIILSGNGKNFCSGGDLKNMLAQSDMFAGDSDELRRRYETGIQLISRSMENLSKPIIAAVNGSAFGAGCDLACMCDFRYGTSQTKFSENFVKVGLVPGDGGTFFLQRIVGYARAVELTLTGRSVPAEEALALGLLNKICDEDKLDAEAFALAQHLAQLPSAALQLSKKALKHSYLHDLQSSLDLLAGYQGIAQRTNDHFEALSAIKENRKPDFNK